MNKSQPQVQTKQTDPPSATVSPLTYLRRLLHGTCLRYTAVTVVALLVNLLLSEEELSYVDPLRFLLFLPFSLCLTLATWIRVSDKLALGAKLALHPLTVLGGFYLCLYLPLQIRNSSSGAQVLIMLLLAALVYGIIMGVVALVTRRTRRRKIEETPYVSQFGPK